ncbi:MAG TPA: aminofutalosine synthase MqnE [Chitinophagales bacterium]|nr:aminofutalosine synthase MqnE [Chitinophagales bacterium]
MTSASSVELLKNHLDLSEQLKTIVEKIIGQQRISTQEGMLLYEQAELGLLGTLANYIREIKNGDFTYFNRNFHIEPTNKCVFTCKFCSYSRLIQQDQDAWELNEQQMLDIVRKYDGTPVTEVHIVGGVHPKMNLMYFANLIRKIKEIRPDIHVKAFTAVELEYMFRKSKVTYEEGLKILKEHGMDSIPGGGAEIFHEDVRSIICKDKATAEEWLEIHETVHRLGMHSNATMLYGHIENYAHRIDHMNRLRELQDRTHGFNTFIPLKFRNKDNEMSHIAESAIAEDLRCYAMSRIFLDNFPHIKAYWPMIGRSTTQLLLNFGVDDVVGTIDDSTKIYSMAGAEDQHPAMTTKDLVELIRQAGRHPIERDTLYNVVQDYKDFEFTAEKPAFYELPVIQN